MSILDKTTRYMLATSENKKGGIVGARMAENNMGVWVRTDDPVIIAMARVYDAVETLPYGEQRFGNCSECEYLTPGSEWCNLEWDCLPLIRTCESFRPREAT